MTWADGTPAELTYPDVAAWVREWLSPRYCRSVDGPTRAWCDRWTDHAEAVSRLTCLWRAWEGVSSEEGPKMLRWWSDCDATMAVLLDEHGPFRSCRAGHSDRLAPLPTA